MAERRIRFEIEAADNEKDNVKEAEGKQRRFVLADQEKARSCMTVMIWSSVLSTDL